MENIAKDRAKIQSHHLYSRPLFIFTALKMQGGSVCHINTQTSHKTLQNTTRQAEFPNLRNTEPSHWREFTFYSQRLDDLTVVFHPADAAGCPRVFNLTSQSRMFNFSAFHWGEDGRKFQFPEFWHSNPTTRTCRVSDCFKCQLCCHKMVTKIPVVTWDTSTRGRNLFVLFLCCPDLGLR